MSTDCPQCQSLMQWQKKTDKNQPVYQCDYCQLSFIKLAICPTCDSELTYLNACGSSSLFCPQCNELKSKSTAMTKLAQR
ncbi:YfgJ family double zinc ribbon protein [Vibrio algicola]|uniref:DNA ligase n=1 Tax=Vibrio algicola TaxID=2662262 RepID=A0A5Q0TED5_9VIBR|nr:zinc-ribbon domain-containing protein [Vibrio algicola]